MRLSSSLAPAPLVKAILVTVVVGLCLLVIPFVQPILAPFLVLPAAHVAAVQGGLGAAIVALAAGGVLLVAGGVSAGLLVFTLVLFVGTVMGLAVRRGWKLGRSLASTAGATFFAFVAWGLALWLVFGVTLAGVRENAYASIDGTASIYAQMGMDAATTESVSDLMHRFVDILPYLMPGLLGMGSILLAGSSLGLAYLLFPRLEDKLTVGLSFSGFRMHWGAAYASIIGLAMVLIARGGGDWRTVVLYAGINILLVSQTLFFVQGLAVVRWFAVSRRLRQRSWVALFVAAVVGQLLMHLTALMGLFDTWVDYRRRFAPSSPGTGSSG